MPTLTPDGRRLVRDLARRHGFSEDAVSGMLAAVAAGHGRMAQFDHPELGGSGQWMSGGMLMLGDMFNHGLKSRVERLCTDLSEALASPGPADGPLQSQTQSRGGAGSLPDTPFFTSSSKESWWPEGLGTPSATGSQNELRYAYFADARRLAVDTGGDVRVHDTLDHRIGGFSQQQGRTGEISMTSQHGRVDLAMLPLVSGAGQERSSPPRETDPSPSEASRSAESSGPDAPTRSEPGGNANAAASVGTTGRDDDPLQLIERLGQLRERGLLTDEEFATKKQELLSRL